MSDFVEKLKSEGVLLAAIPFVASLMAFAYETGYLTYFEVPYDVIDLGLYRIVVAGLWLSVALAVLWVLGARIVAVALSSNRMIKNFFMLIFLIVLIALIIQKIEFNAQFMWILLGSLTIPIMGFLSWVIGGDGPVGKQLPSTLRESLRDGQEIAERAGKLSDVYIGPFSVVLIALGLVGILGYWTAKIDGYRWVSVDDPSFILVRKYGDAYIFKEYDPKTLKIHGQVQVRSLSEEKKISLRRVSLVGLSATFGDATSSAKREHSKTVVNPPVQFLATPSRSAPPEKDNR